jgi:hypothetical protein
MWKCHKETSCAAILNKQNCLFFFYFINSGNRKEQEDGSGLAWESWNQWEREGGGKGCRRVRMIQILCTQVCKQKNDTC